MRCWSCEVADERIAATITRGLRRGTHCADISERSDRSAKSGDDHQHQPRVGAEDAGDTEHPRARHGGHDLGPISRASLW